MSCRLCSNSVQRAVRSATPSRNILTARAASSRAGDEDATATTAAAADASTSTSTSTLSETDAAAAAEGTTEAGSSSRAGGGRGKKFPGPSAWLAGDGQRYKRPIDGRANWIGRTPFPLNESFRPPPPISDAQKSNIYNSFVRSLDAARAQQGQGQGSTPSVPTTESYHVRQLSLKHNLSIDRIRAIIRLKALEANMGNSSTLQYKFANAMEAALGVSRRQVGPVSLERSASSSSSSYVQQSDIEAMVARDPSTGKRANWYMIDEENVEEIEEIAREVKERESSRARLHAKFVNPQDFQVRARERAGSDARSRSIREANPKARSPGVKPKIEFVDVPSRPPAAQPRPAK